MFNLAAASGGWVIFAMGPVTTRSTVRNFIELWEKATNILHQTTKPD